MFLSQSYYGTPKIIRQNINYLVVLKLGGTRDINSISRECSVDLTKNQLLEMYQDATREKFMSLLLIWIRAVINDIVKTLLITIQNKDGIKNNN
jgi:hypothetical protein